jgi:D-alanine-D-alanine ligase
MKRDICIAVVCGGKSRESEVSRVSGRCVARGLEKNYGNVILMELDDSIGKNLREEKVDVVFPVLHGVPGEDGTFQGFLDVLGIPYVGSGVLASASAMDKVVAKSIFTKYGLPVAPDVVIKKTECLSVKDIVDRVGNDVVIKPAGEGSAIGITFCKNERKIDKAIREAFTYGDRVLVEKRIKGKEVTVGILERNGIEALPVIEIRTPRGSWYDFKHRYTPGLSEHIIPAPIPSNVYKRVQKLAIIAHKALFCRDLSRVDFILPDKGDTIILEVNTIPGMTPTSLYPDAARAFGISFEELVAYLVERAIGRAKGIVKKNNS